MEIMCPQVNRERREERRRRRRARRGRRIQRSTIRSTSTYISRFSAAKAGGVYRKRSPSRSKSRSRTPPRSRKVM